MPTLHADYVKLLYSTQKGKDRILHIRELSYLNVILVIGLPERTGQDKMEKTEGFLEGTEVNKDEIISTTNHILKQESNHYHQNKLSSVRRCQALSLFLLGACSVWRLRERRKYLKGFRWYLLRIPMKSVIGFPDHY